MYAFRQRSGPVEVAFTDAEVDLAGVRAAQVGAIFGGDPVAMEQVHGAEVAVVGAGSAWPTADALVTVDPAVTLVVRVADCVPVVVADRDAGLIGVAHAGRRGMCEGVVPALIDQLRAQGARALQAWVGPHICGGCYEVPDQMRAEVSRVVPAAWSQTRWGTPSVDLGRGVAHQLAEAGVDHVAVGGCTFEDAALFSYRRQGAAAGRSAGLVRIVA